MTDADGWIVVPKWDRFQHPDVARNKHGVPAWIRSYTHLMNDDNFLALSFHQRGVLLSIWLEYATARRQLRDNTATLTRRLGQRVTRPTLDSLNHAGYLEHSASKPQADSPQPASPEVEVDGEVEGPLTPRSGEIECKTCGRPVLPFNACSHCGANPRAAGTNPRKMAAAARPICPHCGIQFKAQTLLDEHVYHSHDGPEPAHWTAEPVAKPLPLNGDPDLPPPEERARIAAELRASLLAAKPAEASGNGALPAEELPWEGDEPPVVA